MGRNQTGLRQGSLKAERATDQESNVIIRPFWNNIRASSLLQLPVNIHVVFRRIAAQIKILGQTLAIYPGQMGL
jgi:hypothetical protein